MSKKRTIIRRQKEIDKIVIGATKEEALVEEEPKGASTFSIVDGDEYKSEISLNQMTDKIVMALMSAKQMKLTLVDDREVDVAPTINMNVEPTPIKFEPIINVAPAPIEVRIPTQRMPDPVAPIVNFKNETDLSHLVFILYLLCLILSLGVGVAAWLSLTLSNLF